MFTIDSGSRVNLIKESSLSPEISFENKKIYTLQGISSLPVETKGTVLTTLIGKPTLFHVVSDSVGFIPDGILGNTFLLENAVKVDYKNRSLHYDDMEIPFTENVNVEIKGRTIFPFYINVTNPEKSNGYVPLITPIKGLYFGNALVTNVNGKAYLPIINTTETNHKLEIPSMELDDFEFCNNGTQKCPEETLRSEIQNSEEVLLTGTNVCENSNPEAISLDTGNVRQEEGRFCTTVGSRKDQRAVVRRGALISLKDEAIPSLNTPSNLGTFITHRKNIHSSEVITGWKDAEIRKK